LYYGGGKMNRKEEIEFEKERIYNEIDELDSQRLRCEELRDKKVERLCELDKELEKIPE